jgi:hypothetical protein
MKDVQATGEASSPQKRTSSTLRHDNFSLLLFYDNFAHLDRDSGRPKSTRIHSDPDTQHALNVRRLSLPSILIESLLYELWHHCSDAIIHEKKKRRIQWFTLTNMYECTSIIKTIIKVE